MKKITLSNLQEATEQEVFDFISNHLLTQNKQCWILNPKYDQTLSYGKEICGYRNDEGLKCAAGCLIDDDEYKKEFEGLTWDILILRKKITSKHDSLIYRLQIIHDKHKPEYWKEKLKELSLERKLKFNS